MLWTLHEPREALAPDLAEAARPLLAGGAAIIAARTWLYPVEKQRVVIQLSRLRPWTVLEEYVIRAAALPDQTEPVTIVLTADLLGLDTVFVDQAAAALSASGCLDAAALPVLALTAAGRAALETKQIADNGPTETLEYFFDRKFGALYGRIEPGNGDPAWPESAVLDQSVASLKEYVGRPFIRRAAQVMGREIEPRGSGLAIAGIISATVVEPGLTRMGELWTWDAAAGKAACAIWDFARGCFHDELGAFIGSTPGATGLRLVEGRDGAGPTVRWRR